LTNTFIFDRVINTKEKQMKVQRVILRRWPRQEDGIEYQVVKTYNLIEPVVGTYLDKVHVDDKLIQNQDIEVEIEICGLK
jgi:hypothetical protein